MEKNTPDTLKIGNGLTQEWHSPLGKKELKMYSCAMS